MIGIGRHPQLEYLRKRVMHYAAEFGMTLPEIRFFLLNSEEFMSVLEKGVFPCSPQNIWEGKEIITRRHRIQIGLDPGTYYEVVQCGNPSYAYLNDGNNVVNQASVMAHVCGHAEFSKINILNDVEENRTERVMWLTKQVGLAQNFLGSIEYRRFWNAAASVTQFTHPKSQYNLQNSIEHDNIIPEDLHAENSAPLMSYFSSSINELYGDDNEDTIKNRISDEKKRRQQRIEMSRSGYRIKAPCEDVFGFLVEHAPANEAERDILKYLYAVNKNGEFVRRTQIMNEGWCMYWEAKIMRKLFGEGSVTGVIDYCSTLSKVCSPRPYFARNPYHLGYVMWQQIEEDFQKGKISLAYVNEKDVDTKKQWNRPPERNPIEFMRNLVRTITDYEFIRRYLTEELIHKFHLNRVPMYQAEQMYLPPDRIMKHNDDWVWLNPEGIKDEMLSRFTHFGQPRIYVVDNDYNGEGGLLLYHRNDDIGILRPDWVDPTMRHIAKLWKAPVYLITYDDNDDGELVSLVKQKFTREEYEEYPSFEVVRDIIRTGRNFL